jgi:YidC/Oxa1 family membrane protein insertase
VFFALYKVLYVSLDMRHAPFFGWIHDLSAPDSVNVLDFVSDFAHINIPLHIGAWPLIFGISMIALQKLQAKGSQMDSSQAAVMGIMPYVLVFMFSRFPVGLIIYWSWSNVLSMVQFLVMSRWHREKQGACSAQSTG